MQQNNLRYKLHKYFLHNLIFLLGNFVLEFNKKIDVNNVNQIQDPVIINKILQNHISALFT